MVYIIGSGFHLNSFGMGLVGPEGRTGPLGPMGPMGPIEAKPAARRAAGGRKETVYMFDSGFHLSLFRLQMERRWNSEDIIICD